MLMNKYLEEFHFNAVHAVTVAAPKERIYPLFENLDLASSPIIRLLFSLRGIPLSFRNLKDFIRGGFILLEEKASEEIVLGLVSQPWKYSPGFLNLSPGEFQAFEKGGYAKVAWNFHLSELDANTTRVSTETRVFCTDKGAKFFFSLYWLLISKFSGLIRVAMLDLIQREAERT